MSSSTPIKVIFFDAGGTLIRPSQRIGDTYAALARHYGQSWSPDLLNEGFKTAFKKHRPRPDQEVATNGDEREWWKLVVHAALQTVDMPESFPFPAYFEELYTLYTRPEVWRVFPDAPGVLAELRSRGIRLAVLSNWDNRLLPVLDGLELAPFFEHVLISGQLGTEKPSPKIYETALTRFGIEPAEALMVGDDPLNDYWAPQKAGWHAVLIERPHLDLTAVLDWVK